MNLFRSFGVAALEEYERQRQSATEHPVAYFIRQFIQFAGGMSLAILVADTISFGFFSSGPARRLMFVTLWGSTMAAYNLWQTRRNRPSRNLTNTQSSSE